MKEQPEMDEVPTRAVSQQDGGAADATERGGVRQQTYEALKELILNGTLRPAEKLSGSRLAEMLGVSRTPLREALMKLEKEGLVTSKLNAGYSVANIDFNAACELLVVREALDAKAAELAAEVATPADIARITGIVTEMVALRRGLSSKAAAAATELELGLRIHEIITESTGNEALVRTTAQIYQQLRLALWLEVLWIDVNDESLAEHQAIADAIVARDPVRAAAAARAHVRSSIDNMRNIEEIFAHRRGSLGLRRR